MGWGSQGLQTTSPVTTLPARLQDSRAGKELIIQRGSNMRVRDQTLANLERVLRGSWSSSHCFSTLFPLRKTDDPETARAGQIL